MTDQYAIDDHNKVRQLREKAAYDKETVHGILDSSLVASVGFVQDEEPVVVPMLLGREGGTIYLHGARKARVIRLLEEATTVCINVTHIDALVYARSAFNSSMNYRSATVFASPRLLEDHAEKLHALRIISEQQKEIEALKTEINRLKGLPDKPRYGDPSTLDDPKGKPSTVRGRKNKKKKRGKRPGSAKRAKTKQLEIHKTIPLEIEGLPDGTERLGFKDYYVQDLKIEAHNTSCQRNVFFKDRR